MKLKMARSSGNVFRDVGFPDDEAEHLRVRADLLIQIQQALSGRQEITTRNCVVIVT